MGLLAFQSKLISEEDLISGIKQWLESKDIPLGRIFLEDSSLTEVQLESLETILDSHSKLGGGGLRDMLRSPETSSVIAALISEVNDEEFGSSLSAFAETHEHSEQSVGFPKTVGVSAELAESRNKFPRSGSRYRAIRSHAKGGCGEVFVAKDQELNRDVALKEIQPRYSDNEEFQSRFVFEAEVTGGLEHPGIVPVYGLGKYPDGRPFYAMRFIKGDSLADAITQFHAATMTESERSLKLRQLLNRFIDVCQAVGYAHSRGIVHRDLKPANIMLGEFGETLVVDWGVAKVVGRNEAANPSVDQQSLRPTLANSLNPTLVGSAVGTPAYMPPEQALGDLDQLGPHSDIYSLGATLYCLVAGQDPFTGKHDVSEVLNKVKNGDFKSPRSIDGTIPTELNAICLKAMQKSPSDRYPTAGKFAEDIERFLADEAVTAMTEPLSIKVRRWVRKRPAIVATTAASVLIATVGLLIFSAAINGKNRELARINSHLDQKNMELDQKNTALEESISKETAATTAARKQSQLALSTLSSVIFEIQRGLKEIPRSSEVRRQLLSTSLDKLNRVAKEFVSQSAIDRNTATAFIEMGDLILEFGEESQLASINQTGVNSTQASATQTALLLFQKAHGIFQELEKLGPNNVLAQLDLSFSYGKLGNVCLKTGKVEKAQTHLQKSLEISEELAKLYPNDARTRQSLALAYSSLGQMSFQTGKMDTARSQTQKSLEIREELAKLDSNDAQAHRNVWQSCERLGNIYLHIGKVDEGKTQFEKSLKMSQKLVELDPKNIQALHDLALSYYQLGDVASQLGDGGGAQLQFQASLEIFRKLAEFDPNNTEARRDLAGAYNMLGVAQLRIGNLDEAQIQNQKSLEIFRKLATLDPDNAEAQRNLSVSYSQLGDIYLEKGKMDEARRQFQLFLGVRSGSCAL